MNIYKIRKEDIANGPGIRTSIWVSGCNNHCEGCFNQEIWDFNAGKKLDDKLIQDFIKLGSQKHIVGFSILGGEPLQQGEDMVKFLEELQPLRKKYKKTIWMWTGHVYEDLTNEQMEAVKLIDMLVDGPFMEAYKNPNIKFRGSLNQRIINVPASLKKGKVVLSEVFN